MVKKYLLLIIILLNINLFANETINLNKLIHNKQHYINMVKQKFSYLNKVNYNKFNINEFIKYQNNKNDDFVTALINSQYKGTDYLTKKEFNKVRGELLKYSKYYNQPHEFLLYFISESVPQKTIMNILFQVGILQENGIDITTKQYFIGIPKNFQNYLIKFRQMINKEPKFVREKVIKNSGFKFGPNFFEYFKIKKVPVIVLAKCTGIYPTLKTCKFQYLMHGDSNLIEFFDRIRLKDKKYNKYFQALIANKFKEQKNEK